MMSGPMTSSRTTRTMAKKYRMLNSVDEFTNECLAIWADRKFISMGVIDVLSDLSILRSVPERVR